MRTTAVSAPLGMVVVPDAATTSEPVVPVAERSSQVTLTAFVGTIAIVSGTATWAVPASGSRTVTSPTLTPPFFAPSRIVTAPAASASVAPLAAVSSTANVSGLSAARSARIVTTIPPPDDPAARVRRPLLATKSALPAVPATVRQSMATGPVAGTDSVTGTSTWTVSLWPNGSVTTTSPTAAAGVTAPAAASGSSVLTRTSSTPAPSHRIHPIPDLPVDGRPLRSAGNARGGGRRAQCTDRLDRPEGSAWPVVNEN